MVKKSGAVRRAKLYYLRGRQGKAATRIDEGPLHVRPAAA
ncbi:MAG: 50S ribosomal protein L19 [Patescibacteria group bacterium]